MKSIFFVLGVFLLAVPANADELLSITTKTEVSSKGQAKIALQIKNNSSQILNDIHPMFHFHHSMAMMKSTTILKPGQSVTLVNKDHPPVLRIGRYPIVAMVQYRAEGETLTQLHTDSFFYKEPVDSLIDGRIETRMEGGQSILKVLLRNNSSSFKNIQMMLLLPPGLLSEQFRGMMGFTIRGGEEKSFEIPVTREDKAPDGEYPVHLLIEYGELMKHYVSDVKGRIEFGALWSEKNLKNHIIGILALSLALFGFYKWRVRGWAASITG